MGRWLNIAGHPDGGYAEVDSQPSPYDDPSIVDDTAGPVGLTLVEWQSWSGFRP